MTNPLEGVRILDLTQVQAGPSCTQMLAWMGADVIKIEQPKVGDRTRKERSNRPNIDSHYFLVFNANKRSLTLNLKSQPGKRIFLELVKMSDIVVENYAPGQMEKFELGYRDLKQANRRIIYCTIKGYGTYGPHSDIKSFEHIAQAMSGAMSANGEFGNQPQFVAPGVGDSGSGLHAAIGILAALRQRDNTDDGQRVEVSMQDSIVNLMRIRMIDTLNTHQPIQRAGNRAWGGPSMIYPCKPGGVNDYVAMVLAGDSWESILALAGRGDLVGDSRYATEESRSEHYLEVEQIIETWTLTKTKYEVMRELADLGIPVGAVQDTVEVFNDPHLISRRMIVETKDPRRGDYKLIGCPIKIDSNHVELQLPPHLGEHSEEILATLLEMDPEEVEQLKCAGVI